ncbi:MAG TPA: hypothetical protein VLG38_01695 [Gammaproteobacteria bacterium]|nr:hypothetical protein [Gammaproteobacteria bacterium]
MSTPPPPQKQPYTAADSVLCVQVHTWGTNRQRSALGAAWDDIMQEENLGHAALTITIKDDDEGLKLLVKYCLDPRIPYTRDVYKFIDEDGNEQEQKVIRIFFSPYENKHNELFLIEQIETDRRNARFRRDFLWSERAKQFFGPELRYYNRLGRSPIEKNLGPTVITHPVKPQDKSNVEPFEYTYLKKLSEVELIARQLDLTKLLFEKLHKLYKSNAGVKLDKKMQHYINITLGEYLSADDYTYEKWPYLSWSEITRLYSLCTTAKSDLEDKYRQLNMMLEATERSNFTEKLARNTYLTVGTPESTVNIAIGEYGFNKRNVENMLRATHKIAAKGYFSNTENCCAHIGTVLAAGVDQEHLKAAANNRIFGAFGHPQHVANAASQIQGALLRKEKTNVWHTIADIKPMERINGALWRTIFDGTSILLSIGAAITLIATMPAGYVIGLLTLPFRMLAQSLANAQVEKEAAAARANARNNAPIRSETRAQKRAQEHNTLERNVGKELQDKNVVEIDINDPQKAIFRYAEILAEDNTKIPVFSKTTDQKVKQFLRDHPMKHLSDKEIDKLKEMLEFNATGVNSLGDLLTILHSLAYERLKNITNEKKKDMLQAYKQANNKTTSLSNQNAQNAQKSHVQQTSSQENNPPKNDLDIV